MPWIKIKLEDGIEYDVHVSLTHKDATITKQDIEEMTEMVRAMDRLKIKSVRINEET